jgi:hypothetical protein
MPRGIPRLREEELRSIQRAAFLKTFGEHIAERIASKGKSNRMMRLTQEGDKKHLYVLPAATNSRGECTIFVHRWCSAYGARA